MRLFRKIFKEAALAARNAGQITPAQYEQLVAASGDRELMALARQRIYARAQAAGKVKRGTAVGKVDWTKLLQIIQKFLPVLLELLAILAA